jgi:TP901 family phage tail tape measure protein
MDVNALANQAAMSGNMSSQATREVSVLLSANTGPYQQEMGKAADATNNLADAMYRLDAAYKRALRVIGGAAIGIGASMQAIATGGAWAAAAFEESFARVAKTTGLENTLMGSTGKVANFAAAFGVGDNALQRFENDIRTLSTVIPVSTDELAYLADVAGTLGVESENLVLFADSAAKLGAGINELSSDVAIAGMANLVGAFGLAEEQVVNLGSSLAYLANHTRGSANEMLLFSDRFAGTAVQIGMTADEVLALGAAVSAIGARPEAGASALIQTMNKLNAAIQGGGEEARKFASAMGMSVKELESMWSDQGPTAVLMKLLDTLSLQGDEAGITLQKLGLSGIRTTQVLGGMAAQMGVVTDAMRMSREEFVRGEALGELAAVRFDTVAKSLQRFKQSTSEVFRSLGQGFLVPIQAMIDSSTRLVNLFNGLPQPIKTALGLILGIGGAALTAAGAFTIFFAATHGFWILLSVIPLITRAIQGMLVSIAGANAAMAVTQIERLSTSFSTMGYTILALPSVIKAALLNLGGSFAWILAQMRMLAGAAAGLVLQGFAALGNYLKLVFPLAARGAALALTGLGRALQVIFGWITKETFIHMGVAIHSLGLSAKFAIQHMSPLLWKILQFVPGLAILSGAVYGLKKLWDSYKDSSEVLDGTLTKLAASMGVVLKAMEEIKEAMPEKGGVINLAIDAKSFIKTLRNLDDEEAQTLLRRAEIQLIQSGANPEKVKTDLREIAALAGTRYNTEIELDFRFGKGLEYLSKNLNETIRNTLATIEADPDQDGWWNRFWNVAMRGEAGSQAQGTFEDSLAFLTESLGDASLPTRLAAVSNAITQINEAVAKGQVDRRVGQDWANQLLDAGALPKWDPLEGKNWATRNLGPFMHELSRQFVKLPGVDENNDISRWLTGAELYDPTAQQRMAGVLEADGARSLPYYREIRDLVKEIHGGVGSVGEQIRSLDDSQFAVLTERLRELGVEVSNKEFERLRSGVDFSTSLGHQLALGQGLDPADYQRYATNVLENYPSQVGLVRALKDAQSELDTLIDMGQGFTEEAERFRSKIKDWSQEFARVQVADIAQKLNAVPAAEQVKVLNDELRKLDMTKGYNVEVRVNILEMRQRAYYQAETDFRQTMGRYDQLLEQREQAVSGHQQRLEDMEDNHSRNIAKTREDHAKRLVKMEETQARNVSKMQENHEKNLRKAEESQAKQLVKMVERRDKSIENAHKSHAKRLENIAKQEKKALEDRVEQMAKAFNILQRIQATPTAEIGAMKDNMVAQNRAMAEMTANMDRLRQMGLSEDVMKEMGFDDPKNFAQSRRLLESALSDPKMIDEINKLWKDRLKLSEAFVGESQKDDIRKQFDEARAEAKEALDEQIKDIRDNHREAVEEQRKSNAEQLEEMRKANAEQVEEQRRGYEEQVAEAKVGLTERLEEMNEAHTRSIEDADKNHQRQLENIAEALGKLGTDAAETIDELIERATASGLAGLAARATELLELRDLIMQTNREIAIRDRGFDPMDPASIDRRYGIRYDETNRERGRSILDKMWEGVQERAGTVWNNIKTRMEEGQTDTNREVNNTARTGVGAWFTELGAMQNQDGVWDPTTRAGRRGAQSFTGAVLEELDSGTSGVERRMAAWSLAIERGLNPVLAAVGAEALDIQIPKTTGGRSTSRSVISLAQGGMLPDQARIQSPGTLVQWAEPETGGEAFIPLAASKRQRSREIWAKTGELLGINIDHLDPHSLHVYADGGINGVPDMSEFGSIGLATQKAMEYVLLKVLEAGLHDQALGPGGSAAAIGGGWMAMWGALKAAFPGANLHSGYRPGAITATGRPSYHGQGRAIDVTPSRDIGEWIRDNYMKQTREMIYSPMNSRQIHNGRDHYYATPVTRAMHWDHVHWAMAQGDLLTDKMKKATDNIPIWATNGEFVMQADAVKQYGLEMMEAVNARKFANGGLVGHTNRPRGREPMGSNVDLVGALTKALENASYGQSETNHWDVKVEAQDTKQMIRELEAKKRISRLTGVNSDA